MRAEQDKMVEMVRDSKKGDELFHLKEPNLEDMKKFGLD